MYIKVENVGEEEDSFVRGAKNEEDYAVAIVKAKEKVRVLVHVLMRGFTLR